MFLSLYGFFRIFTETFRMPDSHIGFDFLEEGRFIMIDRLEDLNGDQTADVGDVVYTTENQKPFDNLFGVNLYHVINEDTKKQIIVSEDNIERVKF